MWGEFTLEVRRDQKRGDYFAPGWYKAPAGTVAFEYAGALSEPVRAPKSASPKGTPTDVEVTVRKPSGHSGH